VPFLRPPETGEPVSGGGASRARGEESVRATFTVDTLSDDPQSGTTLREALASANASAGDDTIQFAKAVQGGTVQLSGGQLEITSDLIIDGGTGITIGAQGDSRVLSVSGALSAGPLEVTLLSLTLTGGQTDDFIAGAGIASDNAQLTLENSTISGNAATNSAAQGAGIFSTGPLLTLTNSTVAGNTGGAYGAGIQGYHVTLSKAR
jgi:hypothetical protein